ncbi:MAG: hypothetical protein GQ544_03535, partial [Candidatus Aminicenantes bacterium]|nr:hypothetical protein [Candidatus Aminicenantes bacterium]
MNRAKFAIPMLLIIFALNSPMWGQNEDQGLISDLRFSAGAEFEYFKRTIVWDEITQDTSTLKSLLFTFRPEIDINNRFYIRGIIGYASSDFGATTFRELPLSVEMEGGSLGGLLIGGELEIFMFETGDFEIGGKAQYVYYSGSEKSWGVPGLNVEGSVTGKPKWNRLQAGLTGTYVGMRSLLPYIFLAYDNLWGKYDIVQTIQSLTGAQERKLSSRGKFNATLGSIFELSERVRFTGEFNILPHSDGMDFG